MIPIPFTQHLMPDGRQIPVTFEADQSTTCEAWIAIRRGVAFHAEMLSTGEVSLTAERGENPIGDDVLAVEVIPNGPEVPKAVVRLVRRAYEAVTAPREGSGLSKEERDGAGS